LATIFERIRKVTVAQLGLGEEVVTPSSSFADDLGADSLDMVEIVMALEDEFATPERKVSIPDEDAEKIATVQDIIDYIRNLGISDREAPKLLEKPAPRINLPQPGFHKPVPAQRPVQSGGNQPRGNQSGGQSRWSNKPKPGGQRPAGQTRPQQPGNKSQQAPQGQPKDAERPGAKPPFIPRDNRPKGTP
jgi:acyl carrier protein